MNCSFKIYRCPVPGQSCDKDQEVSCEMAKVLDREEKKRKRIVVGKFIKRVKMRRCDYGL